jgi:hypothetical protein
MSKVGCNHTQAYIVARTLRRRRELAGTDAVFYGISCPVDGADHHITRLAGVIHKLRHSYGWDILAVRQSGKLAVYELVGEGLMPDATRSKDND